MSGGNWKEMFEAACAGDLDLVRYHVNAGVDVNYAHPEFLSTPLVACLLAQQEDVATYLLDRGANPHLRSEFDGLTPIEAARRADLPALEQRLLALGAADSPLAASVPQPSCWARLFSRTLRDSQRN